MRRRQVADACVLAGGALLVGSAFLPWVRHGPGHSLHGHALADAVIALGNNVPGLSGARLTILWYLVPALGACTWVALGLFSNRPVVVRVVALGALVVAAGATLAFGHAIGFGDLGSGPAVAVLGAALSTGGSFALTS